MYEIFEHLLQKFGVTPYKVSKQTGVTQTTLSNWKKGKSTPSNSNSQKIADYFGVSVDYLMTGEEKEGDKYYLIIYGIIHYYKSFAPKLPHVKNKKNAKTS